MAVRRKNCDHCGRPIELRQLGPDRWKPYDPDGTPHDCPGRYADGRPLAGAQAAPAATAAPSAAASASGGAWRWLLVAALGAVAAFVIIPRFFGGDAPEVAQQPPVAAPTATATAASTGKARKSTATATAAPRRNPTATMPAGAADPASAPKACAAFATQPWAQSTYDRNPGAFRDMDPDHDGFA